MNHVIEIPEFYIGVLEKKGVFEDAQKFLEMGQTEFEKYGLPWSLSQALHSSLSTIRRQIRSGIKDVGLRFVSSGKSFFISIYFSHKFFYFSTLSMAFQWKT